MKYPLQKSPIRLSVPYNHAADFSNAVLAPYAKLMGEVYLPVHSGFAHTGRPWSGPAELADYREEMARLAKDCRRLGIRFNFVANQPTSAMGAAVLKDELRRLHDAYPGSCFTMVDFELAAQLHDSDPEMDLQPSTLAHVDDPVVAWYWKSQAGSRCITLHRAANKRLDRIRAIRKLGLQVRVVANDKCLPACPSERNHGAQIQLFDQVGAAWPEPGSFSAYIGCRQRSLKMKNEHIWLVAIKDILPGHLPHLVGLVDLVKLSGRSTPTQSIIASIERYARMEELTNDGPFYREPPEAWERITGCDRVCEACGWCQKHLQPLPASPEFKRDGSR